jgi:hypothetical protein
MEIYISFSSFIIAMSFIIESLRQASWKGKFGNVLSTIKNSWVLKARPWRVRT